MTNREPDVDIEALIARQRPGFTLEQAFYVDPAIFARDVERVVRRQWLFIDHASQLQAPGDYLLYEIAGESIIVLRATDGKIRAFYNVCRHRGSRICTEARGNVRSLVCPYHAWVYELDGHLKHARHMPDEFDPSEYALHPCRVRVWHGLIFLGLAGDGDPDMFEFSELEEGLDPFVLTIRMDRTKIAAKRSYPTHANWKLVVENFRECYHCAPAHPEFTMVNEYVRFTDEDIHGYDQITGDWAKRWAGTGHVTGQLDATATSPNQPHRAATRPIRDRWLTLSEDGRPVAPLLGDLEEFDGGNTSVTLGPLSYMYLANDHVTMFRFTPVSPLLTEVELTWLVRDDALETQDYDLERLIWMWDVTTIADTRIINDNQLGVNSSRYQPGPYAPRELGTREFVRWYLSRIA